MLIAGGLRFIGSNLAHRMIDLGSQVLLIDALIPGSGGNVFNVADIKHKVRINISDVRDSNSLNQLIVGQDYIFDLTGTCNHRDSLDDPLTDLELNCRAHLLLLEACRRRNPEARIVFTSSRSQYGKLSQTPVSEQQPRLPIEPNGIHNIAAEYYFLLYNHVHGLKTTSLRLTNTYGPRHLMQHHKQGVVNWFIKLILDNKEVQLFGDGRQIRDLNYVDDVIEAMLLAATNNMGDYIADCSKIKDQLGWEPNVSLDDGLRKTIEFYERHKQHYW